MNNSGKYFVLMGMIMLSALGFAAIVIILFFVLKLFSVALFNIPGSAYIYELIITVVPYFILFAAYYLVHRKISSGKANPSAVASGIILTIGSLVCIAQLVLALLVFFNFRSSWMITYGEYNKAWFALHLILILIAAGVLATGDPKEKNWLERKTDR